MLSDTTPVTTRSMAEIAAESASHSLTRVHLELEDKASVVIFDDADLGAAVEVIAVAGYSKRSPGLHRGDRCARLPRPL